MDTVIVVTILLKTEREEESSVDSQRPSSDHAEPHPSDPTTEISESIHPLKSQLRFVYKSKRVGHALDNFKNCL